MVSTPNFQVLRRAVINASLGATWKAAVLEWEVTSVAEHPTGDGECVCGQTNLRWMYTVTNDRQGTELFPIGSSCVNHFERAELDQQVNVFRKLVHLRTAALAGDAVTMTTDYFSRAMLDHLYDVGVFTDDAYNGGDGSNDWEFLRKMFGVRDKSTISRKQRFKIRMLIDQKILPFVVNDERLG